AIAEADDVETDRRQQLEPRLSEDTRFQMARERTTAGDDRPQPVGAEGLQREPGLQRAEAARQIRAVITGPVRSGRKSPRFPPQIGGRRRKGIAMALTFAHQKKACIV